MAATPLVYPQAPREYLHDGGSQLVDRGCRWAFGLPQDGQLSSPQCGAMPFRDASADRGLSSRCCVRGEDWEWMFNWTTDRRYLVDTLVFPWTQGEPVEPRLEKGPRFSQLSDMHASLSALSATWRSGFQFQDAESPPPVSAAVFLRSFFSPVPQIGPAPDPADKTLSLQRIERFFQDMAGMKCTAAPSVPYMRDGGEATGAQLYRWWYRYGEPAEQESDFLSSLRLNVDSLYRQWTDADRPVQFDVQFIALLGCFYVDSGRGVNEAKYALVDFLDGPTTLTQDARQQRMFTKRTSWGGVAAANRGAAATGLNPRPDPTGPGEYASFTAQLLGMYAVTWPKYLQLP